MVDVWQEGSQPWDGVRRDRSVLFGSVQVTSIALLTATALFALPGALFAASFDCAKASTSVEKVICGDARLSELDGQLGKLYSDAAGGVADVAVFKQQQKQWISERNRCEDEVCLATAYQRRNSQLKETIASNIRREFAIAKRKPVTFKLVEDTGWNVCHDFVDNLNKTQPPLPLFSCEVQFHPTMRQFALPEWTELNIEEYIDVIYTMENELHDLAPPGLPPFEGWKTRYLADKRAGFTWSDGPGGQKIMVNFAPRLRQAQVRLSADGPLVTVLGYTRYKDAGSQCIASFTECPLPGRHTKEATSMHEQCYQRLHEGWGVPKEEGGDHVFVYEPSKRQAEFILSGDRGAGVSSFIGTHLILHRGRAFLALVDNSGNALSRIEKVSLGGETPVAWVEGRSLCEIPPPFERRKP